MLYFYAIEVILALLFWAFSLIVVVVNIPWDYISLWVGDVWGFAVVFWPLQPVLGAMLAYMTVKSCLFVANLILGSRGIDKA